ncbi:lipopolysaccharide heptosyltransferase I [Undibacterium sp. 5I1]|uniref:lipopolysaccharide heptosyltransferase I n=1 Tax=unclassified Undibacterium TaxID=2630295 RepID=UPI002AB4BD71|nr:MULTISPECIES: lipopolysaccharide heptosyltransferase I [unclassified Undibacterium]MDY7540419.1 lipopolysaccharide heptosyltransferase I [Undibacterium sp. 5I1]MEB0230121.1 lipopolysaccharide heptosyltransferase I [Undibacterium sp. 10I3]MEB0257677.1 lipopolysaccharide heptosyltransferase I [Undibacterium sp. 5I1]
MKILLIRVSSLGDVLHNMPIVDDLLRHFPDAQIDWVVEEAYVHLVKLNPGVRQIFAFALRRWRKSLFTSQTRQEIKHFFTRLREQEYHLVLDTQGLLKTGIIMGMARITSTGKKIGLANGTESSGYEGISRIFHTDSVAVDRRTHAVLRGRLVAAYAGGYKVDTPACFGLNKLYTESQPRPAWMPSKPYAVFFHGTAGASKKWDRYNWVQIAAPLIQQDLAILIPWGNAAEKAEAEQMAIQMQQAIVLPPLSMQDAIMLAQAASIVIGVDTGLTHIAAAYETPTIEIYSGSPRWKTEGNWSDAIINLGDNGAPANFIEVQNAIQKLLVATIEQKKKSHQGD